MPRTTLPTISAYRCYRHTHPSALNDTGHTCDLYCIARAVDDSLPATWSRASGARTSAPRFVPARTSLPGMPACLLAPPLDNAVCVWETRVAACARFMFVGVVRVLHNDCLLSSVRCRFTSIRPINICNDELWGCGIVLAYCAFVVPVCFRPTRFPQRFVNVRQLTAVAHHINHISTIEKSNKNNYDKKYII